MSAITRRMGDVRSLAAAAVFSVVAAAPATHHVAIRDSGFEPSTITVAVNDTVTWTNRGQLAHTVKVDGEESSGRLDPGDTESNTFSTPGTRPYRCEIHPALMTGTIVVQASSTASTTTTTRRAGSTTTSTTEDPLGSSITAPPESTTTSSSLVDNATSTTSSTTVDGEAATRVTDNSDPDDDNVDVPSGIAAVLLLMTAAGAFVQTRGGWG